jgi:hypothetical protein
MARIRGKDLYLNDDDQIYFGNNQEVALWYLDGELQLDHTISGTAATAGYHLIRKDQVESLITSTISGSNIRVYGQPDLTTPTTGKPGIGISGPIVSYLFDYNKDEIVYGTYVVPEDYELNTDITVRLFSMTDSAQTGTNSVVWRLSYHGYADGQSYASKVVTNKSVTTTLPNNCIAGYFKVETFPLLTYNDANNPFTRGTVLTFSISRLGTDGSDTASGDIALIALNFINEKRRS